MLSSYYEYRQCTEMDMDDESNDYVNTEIVCTLAALGYIEGDDYYKGDDCLGKWLTTKYILDTDIRWDES